MILMRNSKVGDVVSFSPMKTKTLTGTILSVEPDGPLRCVGTLEGYFYLTPSDLTPSDAPDLSMLVDDVRPGDVVVVSNGLHRTVEAAVPFGTPPAIRLVFAEQERYSFRQKINRPGERLIVVPREGAS